jgi:hypothetical protein
MRGGGGGGMRGGGGRHENGPVRRPMLHVGDWNTQS